MANKIDTLCVHGAADKNNATGAVTVPVYQAATFAHPGAGQSTGYDYSRMQNPTREALEKTVAALENGCDAMAFSSGMAAMTVLTELFGPGDNIIASGNLYGGSVRLLDNVTAKHGVTTTYLHTGDAAAVRKAVTAKTKAVFVETPTNPMMHITDVAEISKICKERDLLLVVDNTFLTPIYQRPLELGADAVLHSGTKYLGGHNDTLAGFLVAKDPALAEKLRFLYKTIGACLSPWDSFLTLRGIKTLAVRMERITANARKIADWLKTHKKVKSVLYPGQSGMISFSTDTPETAKNVLGRVKTVLYAESLGGVESLITYPVLQTHADVPPEIREAFGINDRLLRLSVGIEDADDLIADLKAALE
ncbi:MAG: PLP-dependent aspartate aminotransferase family protein [Clostridiales bacterium]|jgi:cystathionine gamma-synthase|nr:PLP-dependent aspartate aminotransferase family protein [Clostridiales bacterium]